MSSEPKVVYSHTVEAFLSRIFGRRNLLNGKVLAQLTAQGIDVKKPRDVPLEHWWPVVRLAANTIAAGLPEAEAFREVGQEMLRGFEATVVGKSLFLVLRMMGTRRAMLKMADSYRTADNVTKVAVKELAPNRMELRFDVDGGMPYPTYTQGILLEGIRLVGGKTPAVDFTVEPAGVVVYQASWA